MVSPGRIYAFTRTVVSLSESLVNYIIIEFLVSVARLEGYETASLYQEIESCCICYTERL
jgi:hypothetical protein